MKSIIDALRHAIRQSDQTLYRIAVDAGVDSDTVDRLCKHLGLTLGSASERAGRPQKG